MSQPSFTRVHHAARTAGPARDALLADPGFGAVFTDHMVTIRHSEDSGWHDATIGPRQPIALEPAAAVLHYAQEIFEGLKAYRAQDGGPLLFRPDANARRFRASAARLAMPLLPDDLFVASLRGLVSADRDWIPHQDGASLYLRPFMFATEPFLGVRPARQHLFVVIASPVGSYFKGGSEPIKVWAPDAFSRAAPGGTGAAKCGGNYAGSLVPYAQAAAHGCEQAVFLDAAEHRWIEELGGMNLFFVFDDSSLVTPPLTGTILAGITRDSIITLARSAGLTVREERYSLSQWRADAASGRLTETFACGTAAVITTVGEVRAPNFTFSISDGRQGPVGERLRAELVGIQLGTSPDHHRWVVPVL